MQEARGEESEELKHGGPVYVCQEALLLAAFQGGCNDLKLTGSYYRAVHVQGRVFSVPMGRSNTMSQLGSLASSTCLRVNHDCQFLESYTSILKEPRRQEVGETEPGGPMYPAVFEKMSRGTGAAKGCPHPCNARKFRNELPLDAVAKAVGQEHRVTFGT